MANRNFPSSKVYTGHIMPVLLDCNFVVDSTNGNGLGIRSLKGPGILNVFMHTSASPGKGNSLPNSNIVLTNPNPAAGTIIIQLMDGYNRSFSGFNSIVSPASGSSLLVASAGLTPGVAYIITTVGTTTAAAWHALGVPLGVVPAVGVSFIATATSALGTGAVMITAALGSNIASIETAGDPNTTIGPTPGANQGYGSQLVLQCRNYTGAIAAPADGTVISLAMYLSNSSITVQGE